MDKHDCYELCVQSPRHLTRLLRSVHGADPRVLREDFCGTAALGRRWVTEARAKGLGAVAIAVELDQPTLVRARQEAEHAGVVDAMRFVQGDSVHMPVSAQTGRPSHRDTDACDVIFVGNFSIGYIHARTDLVAYFSRSLARLKLGAAGWGGGVFVCDTYDGPHKYDLGAIVRKHPSRGREMVHYTWEHRDADPQTALVTNAIHFRVELDGDITAEFTDAFLYRWRLWSLPELREAMLDAGFACVEVYAEVADGAQPLPHGGPLPQSGVVCVVARAEPAENG